MYKLCLRLSPLDQYVAGPGAGSGLGGAVTCLVHVVVHAQWTYM